MRLSSALLALACGVAASVAAGGHPPGPAQATAPAPATAASDKKICVQDTSTGSVMPRRTCLTAAQWKARNAEERKDRSPASTVLGPDMARMPDPK